MEEPQYASVVLDVALVKPLDYSIPKDLHSLVTIGSRVQVVVRSKICMATVIEIKNHTDIKKISPIQSVQTEQGTIPVDLLKLGLWMCRYYVTSFSKVVKLLLPPAVRRGMKEKQQLFVKSLLSLEQLKNSCLEQTGLKRSVVEAMLKNPKGLFLSELLEMSGASHHHVTSLEKQNILSLSSLTIDRSLLTEWDFFPTQPKVLNPEQSKALGSIIQSLDENVFKTHLLFGVTGSGKTEVYLQAIQHTLSLGKSALFLVPEIALTSQTLERLRGRFQEKVAVLHHKLSDGQRRDTWHNIAQGKTPLVIGPRSAIFSPLPNLGLIIVDEEHESAYKQTDEMPCYQGKDVAIMRGKMNQAVVLLGSATPSFESYTNALKGKYILNVLQTRADHACLPTFHIIDMKLEYQKASGFTLFSEKLLQGIKQRIACGEQAIVFLNRRGFHTACYCLACGNGLQCPACSVNLTFHKKQAVLSCHLCSYETPLLQQCPYCKAPDFLQFKGAGTEKVESALNAIFPAAKVLRIDADTTRHKGSHDKLLKQFKAGKADLLIGTQMIAKGLHFPSVTLVGILNADASLNIPDFRASEHIFQLITQVSGRSGRSQIKGEVILQTSLPSHPLFTYATCHNYEGFYEEEMKSRQLFHYPPYCSLIKITLVGPEEILIKTHIHRIRDDLLKKLPPSFEILSATPCGHAKIEHQFRFQFLIKAVKVAPLLSLLQDISLPRSIRLIIDVDPASTYF